MQATFETHGFPVPNPELDVWEILNSSVGQMN